MSIKPIILVAGEPDSVFFEIFFKTLKYKKFKSPLILIASQKLLKMHMKNFNFNKEVKSLNFYDLKKKLNNNVINIIDINYKKKNFLEKKSIEYKNYINESFNMAFMIIKKGITNKMINGPINKDSFLNKKFLGMTEYIANQFNIKKNAMLIFNKQLSVCPLTTHLPLKLVSKKISKKLIIEKIILINNFYKINFNIVPKIAVTGINPHCESVLKPNEDIEIVTPSVKYAKKLGYKVFGPYSADTIFQKDNRKKYNVILGMYHDQVLTPIKTLFEFDAINITLGLPFFRVTPDHGPNKKMLNKNLSNPLSLIRALEFLDKK
jgi:4-hydroxy-L-threonine phosphate dehydrogenase PdxA